MKLEPISANAIPRRNRRHYGEYADALRRFAMSDLAAVEVVIGGKAPEKVQAILCQNIARHRHEFAGIKCIRRQGRIFLVKEAEWRQR